MNWSALFDRRTLGVHLDLKAVTAAYQALGNPGRDLPTVHVVGTNGKGSTAAMVDHGLRRHGLSVGLYTSPHLDRVGERVRIDGMPLDDGPLYQHVQTVLEVEPHCALPRPLTFFELLTLAALVAFEAAGVDAIVVEAGLGGRLDATRVVDPQVVAITSIALDHQQFLGTTLAAIAREKGAVMRPEVPAVTVQKDQQAWSVLERQAAEVGCPIDVVAPLERAPSGLLGAHQRHNAALALAAAQILLPMVVADDLNGVHWPGRLQRLRWGRGQVVLDVAHNPAAVDAVVQACLTGEVPRPDVVLFGCMADKDATAMLRALESLSCPLWLVPASDHAHPMPEASPKVLRFDGVDDPRLGWALHPRLGRGQTVMVCGSHHLVGGMLQRIRGESCSRDPQDPRSRALVAL